jgi:NitT/TauT family transport system permease protein
MPATLTPNASVSRNTFLTLIAGWIGFVVLFWIIATVGKPAIIPLLPGPGEVLKALFAQYNEGALNQLLTSLFISLEAIFWALLIGLGLCYLATIPLFRLFVEVVSKLRFLSLAGITLVFLLLAPTGHILKVSLLAFTIIVFLVNDMLQVIDDINPGRFDHARTLGLSNWLVLREVVIRGTLPEAFEALRMNAAMAWMMLATVEGLSRSEGGIGTLLISVQRSGNYAAVFAVQLLILAVGIGQDYLIKGLKAIACPYTVRH